MKHVRNCIRSFSVVFCLLIFLQDATAQSYSDIFNDYSTNKNFTGTVIVAIEGKIIFQSSAGLYDREKKTKFNNNSSFRIASMTKVFTAVLIMRLVQEGKLDLQKTIGDYLPSYKDEGQNKVTLHHLLTYSSGIENILDASGMKPYQMPLRLDFFIDQYCSGKLVYEPGSQSVYGNTEYIILTMIIEQVTGKSYEEYLKEIITKPLLLKDTKINNTNFVSYGFDDSLKTFQKDQTFYPSLYFGAGGLTSTANDLLTFDQAIFNNVLLNRVYTDSLLKLNESLGYTAYGFWGSSGYGNFDEPFYYRTGGILGNTSSWIHATNSKKTIIVLSNTNATNLYQFSEALYLVDKHK